MSAIAWILVGRGESVTGSDRMESPFSKMLLDAGVPVVYEHRAENVHEATLVIASSAVAENNIEIITANQKGIPVFRRETYLADLTSGYQTIAVAGTHGKTTTTGMIAWLLDQTGMDPSFMAGGILRNFGTNARPGKSKLFVVEADEYDRAFLGLNPSIAVVTNVEHDHPDCYPTMGAFVNAFKTFAEKVEDLLLVFRDDPAAAVLESAYGNKWTYGFHPESNWRVDEVRPRSGSGSDFQVLREGEALGGISLQLSGRHNALNALAAIAVADYLGVKFEAIQTAMSTYEGAASRFEILGEEAGITVIDDYAHHPTEIRATLEAARDRYPGSTIWAVFQPHTYSRIRAFMDDFASAFDGADHVLVTEIFAAREEPDPGITGRIVAETIRHPDVGFVPNSEIAAKTLLASVKQDSVVVTLSAGDGNEIGKLLISGLKEGGSSDG